MSGGVRGRENLFDFPSYSIENVGKLTCEEWQVYNIYVLKEIQKIFYRRELG